MTPKILPGNSLQLINIFSNVAEYMIINNKKSVAFLHTKVKQAEEELRETSPFTIATNNIDSQKSMLLGRCVCVCARGGGGNLRFS